eukprot:SAG31_NODE_4995_length_2814_cov_1.128545_2_plen_116_part_00
MRCKKNEYDGSKTDLDELTRRWTVGPGQLRQDNIDAIYELRVTIRDCLRRIFVQGYGLGTVVGWRKRALGANLHKVRFDKKHGDAQTLELALLGVDWSVTTLDEAEHRLQTNDVE